MARSGRPTKYTEDKADAIVAAVRAGATLRLAAASAGISLDTLARWRKRFAAFADRLTEAEGKAAVRPLALIAEAAKRDWRAAAWLLERRFPEEYGRQRHEHTGADGGPIEVEIVGVDVERL